MLAYSFTDLDIWDVITGWEDMRDNVVLARALIITVTLCCIFMYFEGISLRKAGIERDPQWLPLAFAFLFVIEDYKQKLQSRGCVLKKKGKPAFPFF